MTEGAFASLVSKELPRLTRLLGGVDGRAEEFERLGLVPLWQIEQDLGLLERYRSWDEISRAYRVLLRNPRQFIHALFEIRVAAMLAPFVDKFELAPRIGAGSCDLKCEIEGGSVFIEVSTKADQFPPKYDGQLYERASDEAPHSLRERMVEKLGQLPRGEMTVVVVGSRGGRALDMECALFGDEELLGRKGGFEMRRVFNGLFAVPDEVGGQSGMSAVVWLKLAPHFHDVRAHGRLFLNNRAARPLSDSAASVFRRVFDRGWVLGEELERIKTTLINEYHPERLIVFGSVAEALAGNPDRVHEGSDIDLAIVKATPLRFGDRIKEVLDMIEPRVGVNVLVYTPDELRKAEESGQAFVTEEILKKGRVLFP